MSALLVLRPENHRPHVLVPYNIDVLAGRPCDPGEHDCHVMMTFNDDIQVEHCKHAQEAVYVRLQCLRRLLK